MVDTEKFNLFKIDLEDEDVVENDTSEDSMDESRILGPAPRKDKIEADTLKVEHKSVEEANFEEQDEGTDEEESDKVEKNVNSDECLNDDEKSEDDENSNDDENSDDDENSENPELE